MIDAIGLAAMLVDVGRVAEAADRYRALGPVTEWVPSPVVELVIYAFAVHVAVAMNAADDLAALRELLTPYRGLHVSGRGGAVYYSGPVELYLGVCAANLDLLDDAIADLGTAAEVCARIGAAGFHAEALCELATVLARRGTPADLTRAHQLATAAAAEAATLGMTPWVDRLDQLTQTLDGPPPDVLTPREREVAELVTQGLTNRDIASRLYLSERTAQNHVQHILTKLDMRSRGQIAVWITSQR